jgi:hypothetical protein
VTAALGVVYADLHDCLTFPFQPAVHFGPAAG